MHLPFLDVTLPELIAAVGYVGVFLMVYVESGVPFGIILPLPGDTLLFSAGILAAAGTFNLIPLVSLIVVAAILGDSTGYWFGKKYGPKLFTKEEGMFLNKGHLERTERFYLRHGRGALILARFLPVFRTLVPIFAGVGRMDYRAFLAYNIAGALIWGVSVTVLGYYLGTLIPNIDHYLLPILLVILLLSSGSMILEFWKVGKKK
jgi:membrane-associated protein